MRHGSIAKDVAVNRMTPQNLGVVFGPTLLRTAEPGSEFQDLHKRARIVELCVERADVLFD
jgi:Rac GTPase-activating protein 1